MLDRLKTDRNWLMPAVVFAVGLLLGWFVLGWFLFPVQWKNASPRELSDASRDRYLSAVADSYAANLDITLAASRLQSWTPHEAAALASQLAKQYEASEQAERAENLRTLASALGGDAVTPAAPETNKPTSTGQASNPGSLIALLLGVIIVGAGLGVGAWWLTSWLQARNVQPQEVFPPEPLPSVPVRPAAPAQRAASFTDFPDDDFGDELLDEFEMPSAATESVSYRPPPPPAPLSPVDSTSSREVPPSLLLDEEPLFENAPIESNQNARIVAEFDATYQQGDPDYDEAFVVDGASGAGYRGECGMGIGETLDRERTQATAIEVWLFDKSDIRTVTTVLMSDYAYGDPRLHERMMAKGDILLIAPNATFDIQAKSLRLQARVVNYAYADGTGPARSVFARLTVRLTVFATD